MSRAGPGRLSTDQSNEPAAATPATSFTLLAGTVLFLVPNPSVAGTTNASGDNAEFFWDNSLKRLGLGTNSPSAPLHLTDEDARTNTVAVAYIIGATTTGTPAVGIGTGLRFDAESADEAPSQFGRLDFVATDVTAASEDTVLDILARVAGAALAAIWRFAATGAFRGIFTHANTADRTYTLQNSSDTLVGRATTDTLTGKTLLATGTGNVVSGILDRDVTTNDVVDTLTETTVYTFSVPTNTLSTNRALRLTLLGDYLNNSGAGTTDLNIRVNWGSQNQVMTFDNVPASASRRGIRMEVFLSAANATNAQIGFQDAILLSTGVSGGEATSQEQNFSFKNDYTQDSTIAQTLAVTFQHSEANANISARALAVQLEVLP